MEKTVIMDGKPVALRCTAALPRLYRATFQRDFFGDLNAVYQQAERTADPESDTESDAPRKKRKKRGGPQSFYYVTFLENLTFLMARSADPVHVPPDITRWLDSFSDPQAVLSVAEEVIELYQLNNRTTAAPKKKDGP